MTPAARFATVERVITDHGYSERRACGLIGVDRSSFQYERKGWCDATVRVRLRELANERRRFGYRRLAIMLKREGLRMNLKKVYRLYKVSIGRQKEPRIGVQKGPLYFDDGPDMSARPG
jgi:putative transposase